MLKNRLIPFLLIFLSQTFQVKARNQENPEGRLLILGGAATNEFFINYFKEEAGGDEANLVIIPTAMTEAAIQRDSAFIRLKAPFKKAGFKDINVVHTRSIEVAETDSLSSMILEADAVWITGGRQWRLAMVYNGTKVHDALRTILDQGAIIAGTSAGASIMADLLVRGDPSGNTIMLGEYQEGFGFLTGVAIDQHHLARNRQFDLFEVKKEHPDVLGIGLEENTGILVSQNKFEVVGKGYVGIYDGTRWSAERDTIYQLDPGVEQFYLLGEGRRYDLKEQKVILK